MTSNNKKSGLPPINAEVNEFQNSAVKGYAKVSAYSALAYEIIKQHNETDDGRPTPGDLVEQAFEFAKDNCEIIGDLYQLLDSFGVPLEQIPLIIEILQRYGAIIAGT